jgi:hypothetical protein
MEFLEFNLNGGLASEVRYFEVLEVFYSFRINQAFGHVKLLLLEFLLLLLLNGLLLTWNEEGILLVEVFFKELDHLEEVTLPLGRVLVFKLSENVRVLELQQVILNVP